jgi:nitrogen fixation protein FixH
VRVRLSIAPGAVGSNAYTADVTDYDTGKPVPAQTVQLRFSYPAKPEAGTATADLQRRAPGSAEWHGSGTELSLDGLWDIDVVVQEAATSVTVPLQFRTVLPPEQVSMSVAVGQPTLSTVTLAGGDTMQAYVDPGTAGPNAVHFTFFQQSGDEQPVKSAAASSISPAGASQPIKLIRFDPGHFVSNQTLTPGKWTFRINATLADGTVLSAYFNSTVGPSASAAQTSGSPSPAPSLISKESP